MKKRVEKYYYIYRQKDGSYTVEIRLEDSQTKQKWILLEMLADDMHKHGIKLNKQNNTRRMWLPKSLEMFLEKQAKSCVECFHLRTIKGEPGKARCRLNQLGGKFYEIESEASKVEFQVAGMNCLLFQ